MSTRGLFYTEFKLMCVRLAGRLLTPVPKSTSQGVELLKPLIEERLKQHELHGKDWPDKPVNYIISP